MKPDAQRNYEEAVLIEELKKKSAVLEKSLEEKIAELEIKNHELEIESSLERVRAQAMNMQKPEDLAAVNEIIFCEFKALGFSQLRNTEIIINKDEKESILSYYYSDYGISGNIEVSYNQNPVMKKWATDMQQASDAFAAITITELEMDAWRRYREEVGYLPDHKLNAAKTVYYYSYSIGLGALSVSTWEPTNSDQLKILERFRNVFGLAYRRYADVAKAEAQAREAQIEAALERVRARTMTMQKSDKLSEVASLLFRQITELGTTSWSSGFNIWREDGNAAVAWMANPDGSMGTPFLVPYTEDPFFKKIHQARQSGNDFFVMESGGKELEDTYEYLFNLPSAKKHFDGIKALGFQMPAFQITHYAFFSHGYLMFITYEPVPEMWDIFRRFARIFEQTYTRFLDLQKAENQAREARIEAALERARTHSMMMQHSNELDNVLRIFHEQVLLLGIDSAFSFLWLPDEKNDRHIFWAAWAEELSNDLLNNESVVYKSKAIDYPLDRNEPATAQCLIDWKGREPVVSYHVPPAGVEAYFSAWQELIAGVEQLRPEYFLDGLYYVEAFMKYGCFGVMVKRELPFEERKILYRFATEFERTYTRFLDLQKAEAQAREARIEAALERVRSRAMAMQKTEELLDAADLVAKELSGLGINSMNVSYAFMDEKEQNASYYSVNPLDGKILPFAFAFPHTETEVMRTILASWKRQDPFNILELDEASTLKHQTWAGGYINYIFDLKGIPFSMEEFLNISPKKAVIYTFNFTNGYLFAIGNARFTAAQEDIVLRVMKVFDMTYRRFLDLKQAESQAREARIEAALERVRSRSMGMQKSEELKEVIQVVYEQFVHLNIHIEHTGFVMDFKPMGDWNFWIADRNGTPAEIKIPYFDSVWGNSFNDAKQKRQDFFATHLNFEEKNNFYSRLLSFIPGLPEETRQFYFTCTGLAVSTVLLENVALYIENFSGTPYSAEENAILMRFGKVFEQTYTRFLDLKKAEAQARESQVEAALERVRSRTMAMQHSNELPTAANILFQQVQSLGMPTWSAGYCLWENDKRSATFYMSSEGEIQIPFSMPLTEEPALKHMRQGSEGASLFYVDELEGEICSSHYAYMRTLPGINEILDALIASGFPLPTYQINHMAYFSHGFLLFITYKPVPESHDIFKRFAKVFEQTYTRFLDLQRAEAQGLEAIKRASVDRVRAEIASMRTTADLEKITPLIWNELTTLDVPFIRCGVFIMDEEEQQVNTYLSNPEGQAIAAFHQPYDAPGDIAEVVKSWRKKEMYTRHWDEAMFLEVTKNLVQQGGITSGEKYLTEHHPTDLYLHFLPFLQGMLYVGNILPLKETELQLVQNLADAFSTAYARYEDFNKLENAKEQVDKTLADLKQAQAQLVQSEKMASLGELTAGIAHEIQNPLNFVNNFSEVNAELSDEIIQAAISGNLEEIRLLAADIKSNQEKIRDHGKRADSIVKGMLQHSRTTTGEKLPTDINALADEYLRLAYHGLRAKDKTFNATLETDFDQGLPKVNIIPQDIGRVMLNLISNAFYAVDEKKKSGIDNFEPTVAVNTKMVNGSVEVVIRDNGNGIPQKVMDKIFQPFFTTKPTGQGTGLGLSLAYDIVKAHGGEIKVETKEREGTSFIINIPIN